MKAKKQPTEQVLPFANFKVGRVTLKSELVPYKLVNLKGKLVEQEPETVHLKGKLVEQEP